MGYCKICESCGEEMCCSPTRCEQHPDGKYCEYYLEILKDTYKLHVKIVNEIYTEEEKYLKLINIIETHG